MFNLIGFFFSILKGIYFACANYHTHVNRQARIASTLFARFFGIFSINKNLFVAEVRKNDKKTIYKTDHK